jgi:type I restriction enzyme, S subunit
MVEAEENLDIKITEVGVIPEDWKVKPLKCVADFGSGTTPSRSLSERYFLNGTVHWVKTMDLNNGHIYDTSEKVTELALKEVGSLKVYPPDTVLVAMYGGFNQIGRTGILKINAAVNQALVAVQAQKSKLDPDYLIHYLNYRIDYWRQVASSSRKDPNITGNDVKQFPIALPPTKDEQGAIAEVLNNVDKLIKRSQRLIKKKKNIRQGVMHKLLHPKESWIHTTVEKLGKPYSGLSGKSKIDFRNGDCPYIPFMNVMSNPIIDTNYFDFVKIRPFENQNKAIIGDLFFNGSSETPEEVGMCSVLLEDIPSLYLNSFCFGFRLFPDLQNDGLYLAYFFRSTYGRRVMFSLAQGATRHNLSKTNFLNIAFQIPDPNEQKEISKILLDLDKEIKALEIELEKYKRVKEGIRQNLLTGKIRLI